MISVRLRKGNAVTEMSGWFVTCSWRVLTVVSEESDDEIIAQGEEIHGVAKEVGNPVVGSNKWQEEEL